MNKRWIVMLQAALILLVAVDACHGKGEDVSITFKVSGLPPGLSSKLYINGTSRWVNGSELTVGASSSPTINFTKGSFISVTLDAEITDNLGNIYTLSGIEYEGRSSTTVTFRVEHDAELSGYYSWSHILLSPLLWPFYALLILLLVHMWLTSRIRRGERAKASAKDPRIAANDI